MKQWLKIGKKIIYENKITIASLALIWFGYSVTRYGDYISYVDELGWCHDSALMPLGLLISMTGLLGIATIIIIKIISYIIKTLNKYLQQKNLYKNRWGK